MRLFVPSNIFILDVQNGQPLMLELITVYSRCVGSVEQRTPLRNGLFSFCNWGELKKGICRVELARCIDYSGKRFKP
jgi:hypothetical protein